MSNPDPFFFPQLWDQITILGMTWGGPGGLFGKIQIIGATRFYKIDQKDGAGVDGATQTYRGQKPKQFKLRFSWWNSEQHQYWAQFSLPFNYTGSKPGLPPPVFPIYHPKLALLGINAINIEEVGAVDVNEDTKEASSVVTVRQFYPPALTASTATPAAAPPGTPPNVPGAFAPTAEEALIQADNYVLAALIAGAGTPGNAPHP